MMEEYQDKNLCRDDGTKQVTRSLTRQTQLQPHLYIITNIEERWRRRGDRTISTRSWSPSLIRRLKILLFARFTTGGRATLRTTPVAPPAPQPRPFHHPPPSTSCTPPTSTQPTSSSRFPPSILPDDRLAPARTTAPPSPHARSSHGRLTISATPPTSIELPAAAALWDSISTESQYYFHLDGAIYPSAPPYLSIIRPWR